MKRPISIAHLTLLELTPPELIRVAAQAGFDSVGLRLIAVTETTLGYPLMDNSVMLHDTIRAIEETGVTINDIEFVRLAPKFDLKEFDGFLEAGAKLGARYIVTAPYDPDLQRLSDNLSALAEHSAGYDLVPVLEFFPWTSVPDFQSALKIVEQTGNRSIGVLVDTLHFNRSNSRLSDLASSDPKRLPFVHVSDAPVKGSYSHEDLLHTARTARLIPGHGNIPITEILSQMPCDIPISFEIPLEDRGGLSSVEIALEIRQQAEINLKFSF